MQEYIEEKQAAADAIICSNPGVLEEFRRREAHIAELEVQVGAAADKVSLVRELIADLKVRPPLAGSLVILADTRWTSRPCLQPLHMPACMQSSPRRVSACRLLEQ